MSFTESDRQAFRQRVSEYAQTLNLPSVVGIINDMVDRHMYEQAEQEEKRALALISDMWGIIQELAQADTYIFNGKNAREECIFCTDWWGYAAWEKQTKDHTQNCLVSKARKLVEERGKTDEHATSGTPAV